MQIDRPTGIVYRFPVAKNAPPELEPAPPPAATEEAGAQPIAAPLGGAGTETKGPRGFLQVGRRNLNEQELANPVAIRFLIAELERLDQICGKSDGIVEQYHEQRVTIASLTEAARPSRHLQLLSNVCLGVGCAGLGAAPGYFSLAGGIGYGLVILALSAVLVLASVFGPRVRK